MNRVLFKNPPKDIFFKLRELGLVDFYVKDIPETEHLKGKKLYENTTIFSENAIWGNFADHKIHVNTKKNFVHNSWISATIDINNEGLKILKRSNIKDWEIIPLR